jgi:hypothetical protein
MTPTGGRRSARCSHVGRHAANKRRSLPGTVRHSNGAFAFATVIQVLLVLARRGADRSGSARSPRSDRRGIACHHLDLGFATGLKSWGLIRVGPQGPLFPRCPRQARTVPARVKFVFCDRYQVWRVTLKSCDERNTPNARPSNRCCSS